MTKASSITGAVVRVIFENEEDGFAICAFAPDGSAGEIVIVGNLFDVAAGERLHVRGSWEQTRRGPRLVIESYEPLLPQTAEGIQRYLGSGIVPGIGPVNAKRIVKTFGEAALQVLDETPERLREVEGIGPKRSAAIAESWQRRKSLRNLSVFLQGAGLSPTLAPKIVKALGAQAIRTVRDDPYQLALRVHGIGFQSADRVAASLGIERASPKRAAGAIAHALTLLADEGHSAYPQRRLEQYVCESFEVPEESFARALADLDEAGFIRIDRSDEYAEPFVYLTTQWEAEREAADLLRRQADAPSRLRKFDAGRALQWLKQRGDLALSDRQAEAVVAACTEKVLVVTGGPGTGKTTIIKSILDVLGVLKGEGLLAAPTGRAAKRLSETTGHEAKTLHRLLALRPGAEHHAGRITVDPDVFIVDEASMVDLTLMAAILRSLAPHTHLVLVGDVDQLPSVGAGDVLRDIIRSERFRVVTLNEIFRQDAESLIVANAHRILAGGDLSLPDKGDDADFHFIVRDNPAGAVGTIVDLVADRLPARFGLDPVRDIVVLSPMHKGDTGVKKLNEALQQRLNPHGPAVERGGAVFRAGDRVLQTANDYDREIFNGDLGVIVHADPAERRLVVDFDGRRVTVEGAELGDLAPAYAISVHKSQGSEYPAVVIALSTYHFVMLKRNLLYTAITRAKKLVVIVGSRRALERAIANNEVGRRYGLLRERLARTGRGAL